MLDVEMLSSRLESRVHKETKTITATTYTAAIEFTASNLCKYLVCMRAHAYSKCIQQENQLKLIKKSNI